MEDLHHHIAELKALAQTQEGEDRERTEDHIHDLENDLRELEDEQRAPPAEEPGYLLSGPFINPRMLGDHELE